MPVIAWYWSVLESDFHGVLQDYAVDRDPDDIRCDWLKFVRATLSKAWEQHSAAVSTGDAWEIRALVKAEGQVLRKLKQLKKRLLSSNRKDPEKEDA